MMLALLTLVPIPMLQGQPVLVSTSDELQGALTRAVPGTIIQVAAGTYSGGIRASNIHGSKSKPITISGASGAKFVGGKTGLHFSSVSYIEIRNLQFEKQLFNGLNIDDGGNFERPSHHLTISNIHVSDLPKGNHDGIKLSGVSDFRIENCVLRKWGGSGIDMVGCHRGVITGCKFANGGDNGVQAKGGSEEVRITKSSFINAGQRGVNLGGSTGLEYFRPPITKMPAGQRFEARNLKVDQCIFVGGTAPIAFVGVDGATVSFNTIYLPEKWAIRILQETATPDFVKCRNGRITDNIFVTRNVSSMVGAINIGPNTDAASFKFERNFWYCENQQNRSLQKPQLPGPELDGVYGLPPQFIDPGKLDFQTKSDSPARYYGAHAVPRENK